MGVRSPSPKMVAVRRSSLIHGMGNVIYLTLPRHEAAAWRDWWMRNVMGNIY